METRDNEIDEEMAKPEVATNVAECVRLSKEKAEIAQKLEELYEKWKNWQSNFVDKENSVCFRKNFYCRRNFIFYSLLKQL